MNDDASASRALRKAQADKGAFVSIVTNYNNNGQRDQVAFNRRRFIVRLFFFGSLAPSQWMQTGASLSLSLFRFSIYIHLYRYAFGGIHVIVNKTRHNGKLQHHSRGIQLCRGSTPGNFRLLSRRPPVPLSLSLLASLYLFSLSLCKWRFFSYSQRRLHLAPSIIQSIRFK